MMYKDFAKIIRKKRLNKGLSQKEMAYEIPLSNSNYNKIENGNIEPNFFVLQRICQILDIDLTEVLELKKPRQEHIKLFD
ncbi:MAG: helix-turn-helix transcriptional regulator [Acholeplasmatales bacterium]|nr:helix-turn-helix transcriptional regulator [Acholeplasmatales bacterium]